MKTEKSLIFLAALTIVCVPFSTLAYLLGMTNWIIGLTIILLFMATISLLSKIRYFNLLFDKLKLTGIDKLDALQYNYQPIKYFKIFLIEFLISFGLLFFVIYLEEHIDHSNFYSFILSPIVSYFLVRAINNLLQFFTAASEEPSKRNDNLYKLKEYYHDNYVRAIKVVDEKGNKDKYYQFMYDSIIDDASTKKLTIIDDATDFMPPPLIRKLFYDLLKANSTSTIKNFTTVRMNDLVVNDNSIALHIGRSEMYYDLVTNRIPDLTISGITTIRDMYEEGPLLSSLSKSQMSNHIGINVIVTLATNGETRDIILPIRDGLATMSKYQTTSALAFGLAEPDKEITSDFLRCSPTKGKLPKKCNVVEEKLAEKYNVAREHIRDIKLIGIGRDICSAGKPQMYYWAELNLDRERFLDCYLMRKTTTKQKDESIVNRAPCQKNDLKIDNYKYVSIVSIDELLNLKYKDNDTFELNSNMIDNDLLTTNITELRRKYEKTVRYIHRFETQIAIASCNF